MSDVVAESAKNVQDQCERWWPKAGKVVAKSGQFSIFFPYRSAGGEIVKGWLEDVQNLGAEGRRQPRQQ
jgi:hypothetical protein